jgi:uncharacterized protein (DUF362 family)
MEASHLASVTLGRARNGEELRKLLAGGVPASETYLVKPNWYSPHPANFTGAEALGILMDALDGRVVVVEGYSGDRHDGSMRLSSGGEKVDWRWLLKHPDWGWAKEDGTWDEIRRQDRWFLDHHGFTDVIGAHDAEYLNITEEIWSGRAEKPEEMKELVESHYSPVQHEQIYGFMPSKLWRLRGSSLVSLGRVKGCGGTYPSLTLKNLFGLVPDPYRSWWHGPKDRDLSRSIVDIAKLYASAFTIHGVCEAFSSYTVNDPGGEVKVPWGAYRVMKSDGFVAHGPSPVELDAVLCALIRVDPSKVGYLQLGEKEFGPYDKGAVAEASAASAKWFPSQAIV